MFKIEFKYGSLKEEDLRTIITYEDPLVVDCRKNAKESLINKIFGKEYVCLKYLINKGTTKIFLNNKDKGIKELKDYINKCEQFDRECVVIAENVEHLETIKQGLQDGEAVK